MAKTFLGLLFVSIIITVVTVFFWFKSSPHIIITPERALIDEPIEISVTNLKPHAHITIEATCKNKDNDAWKSYAIFQANDKGVVNVAQQAPISGSYTGIDPMGLLWSMRPTSKDPEKNTFLSQCILNIGEITLSVLSENKLLTHKIVHRLYVSSDVQRKEIREQGIAGTLFYQKSTKNNPGIIVIPGSGGGIPENIAQVIASHGYTVLALAYFGVAGLPEHLSMIPLEYFQQAMNWFKKQPQVEGNKIAIMGHSRGGELAILLASIFPGEMGAAIAYSAPHLVYGDFSPDNKSAWTYKNKPLPFMAYPSDADIGQAAKEGLVATHRGTIEDPFQDAEIFLWGTKKFSALAKETTIPVENISCPLLIISGDDDKMWPSSVAGQKIIERLNSHNSMIKHKHLHYQNAGHNLFIFPYVPSIDLPVPIACGWSLFGGTPEGNAHAVEQSWKAALEFLKETLEK